MLLNTTGPVMIKPLQQQTFAKLGLYTKNPYLKKPIFEARSSSFRNYILLLLTALTASGVVIYLMKLPTDYIVSHG